MIGLIRSIHTLIALMFICCIVVVYYSGITKAVNVWLYLATGALFIEGIVLTSNRGDCPLAYAHRKYGDDKAFFELFMPKHIAKHMIRVVPAVTAMGYILLLFNFFHY